MATETVSASPLSEVELYEKIESYDWSSDVEFAGGLQSILQSAQTPEQASELEARAKCFFLSRKHGVKIDVNNYRAWKQQKQGTAPQEYVAGSATAPLAWQTESKKQSAPAQTSSDPAGDAPYPTSFADIVELITSGKPIPGIKDIPDTVLEGQGTQPTASRRKKPWEKDEA